MELNEEFDLMFSLCRLCKNTDNDMESLYESDYDQKTLHDILMEVCSKLEVMKNDGLTELICSECKQKMISFYQFQNMCMQTEFELKALTNSKTDEIDIKPESLEFTLVEEYSMDIDEDNKFGFTVLAECAVEDPEEPDYIKEEEEDDFEDDPIEDYAISEANTDDADEINGVVIEQADVQHLDYVHKCHICLKEFELLRGLDRHLRMVHDPQRSSKSKGPKVCEVCNKVFGSTAKYMEHAIVHDPAKKQKYGTSKLCDICGKSFSAPSKVYIHKLTVHGDHKKKKEENDLKCEICEREFNKPGHLSEHRATVHNPVTKPHKCEKCWKRFKTEVQLMRHQVMHTYLQKVIPEKKVEQKVGCEICQMEFKNENGLWIHTYRAHPESVPEKYKCEHCEKELPDRAAFKKHMDIHIKPFKCPLCEKSFGQEYKLVQHVNYHQQVKPFACSFCPAKYYVENLLRDHEMSKHKHLIPEADQLNFICTSCGKSFLAMSSLRVHQRTHDGNEYSCTMCPKVYKAKAYLDFHMKSHDQPVKFVCHLCGAAYSAKATLRDHLRKHNNDPRYTCEYCGKDFFRSSTYKRHILSHTGEKPYPCPFCERMFSNHGDLYRHKKQHLGEQMYACKECGDKFQYKKDYEAHMTEHFQDRKRLLHKMNSIGDAISDDQYLVEFVQIENTLEPRSKIE